MIADLESGALAQFVVRSLRCVGPEAEPGGIERRKP
jgi:hypothetical protein